MVNVNKKQRVFWYKTRTDKRFDRMNYLFYKNKP